MNAADTMLCWDPESSHVGLVAWPDTVGTSNKYRRTALACYGLEKLTFEKRKALVFVEAMHLVVRDKVDPMAVHRALLGLDEYRDGCADDMPGMPE